MDYNVDSYTIPELLEILELDDPDPEQVTTATDVLIDRFTDEQQPQLVNFFQDMQTKLLRYIDQLDDNKDTDAEYAPDAKQTDLWYKYQALPQNNTQQRDKITNRIQKVDIYDNDHVPMNREQLGVSNTFDTSVAQDTLNPTLKNTIKRFINLDSQYRQAAGGIEAGATDYTLDLSDPVLNVLNLQLYSIQIPHTWYTIDYAYGNTCFWLTNQGNSFQISIEPGNYEPADFCVAIQEAFTRPFATQQNPDWTTFTYNTDAPTAPIIAHYNIRNCRLSVYLDGWQDPAGNQIVTKTPTAPFNSLEQAYFTFLDVLGGKTCYESGTYPCGSTAQGQTLSQTLGWLMGFRLPIQPLYTADIQYTNNKWSYSGGNKPINVVDLYGPKYFIVVLDDYNQNHLNNGLITITELSKSLDVPTYYNASQPYICEEVVGNPATDINTLGNVANMTPQTASALGINLQNISSALGDKHEFSTSAVPTVLPSAPRTLTSAQIYTVNEILKNRNKTTSFRAKPPTATDTFAIIPLKANTKPGDVYVEFSGTLQENKRTYFGPVNIERMHIKLLNDKGFLVDLHGGEWTITLIVESLYQY